MISFQNTEKAFQSKSKAELKKAQFVFQLIALPWLNKIGTGLLSFSLKIGLPVKGIVKASVFNHFCGGETIIDCQSTMENLAKHKVQTILDYSVEGKQEDKDFDRCLSIALEAMERSKEVNFIPFCVIKLTGLIPFHLLEKQSSKAKLNEQETKNWIKGLSRVESIAEAAAKCKTPLMIDAEETWIQDAIDEVALELMKKYNKESCIIYNTAQMYRHDRLDYLQELCKLAKTEGFLMGIKIVRGAYMEKERERALEKNYPSPIQKDKESTDKDYDEALKFCIKESAIFSICAGTHNEKSSLLLTELMQQFNIKADDSKFFFAQLLGMSDHISFNLSDAGFQVAKYVPFGPVKDVMPYLIRRANENSSIAGQTSRELSLIKEERKRRKTMHSS